MSEIPISVGPTVTSSPPEVAERNAIELIGAASSERIPYGFEFAWDDAFAKGTKNEYLEIFKRNLGLTRDTIIKHYANNLTLTDRTERILLRYVASVHINLEWYNGAVRKQKFMQTGYLLLSIALLTIIPILIYKVPEALEGTVTMFGFEKGNFSEIDIPVLTTIVLSGLFSIHKVITSLIQQRNRIAPVWRARMDLLDILYELETRWGGQDIDAKVIRLPGHKLALSESLIQQFGEDILDARQIIRTEKDEFFANYTVPQISLSDTLNDSASAATKLMPTYKSARQATAERNIARREALEEAKFNETQLKAETIKKLNLQKISLTKQIRAKHSSLEQLKQQRDSLGTDETEKKKKLQTQMDIFSKKISEAEAELSITIIEMNAVS